MGQANTHAATASRELRRGRKAVYKHTRMHTQTGAQMSHYVSPHKSFVGVRVRIHTFRKTTGKKRNPQKSFIEGKKTEFPTTQTRTK